MALYEMRKFVAPEFIFGVGARKRVAFYARNMMARRVFLARRVDRREQVSLVHGAPTSERNGSYEGPVHSVRIVTNSSANALSAAREPRAHSQARLSASHHNR